MTSDHWKPIFMIRFSTSLFIYVNVFSNNHDGTDLRPLKSMDTEIMSVFSERVDENGCSFFLVANK